MKWIGLALIIFGVLQCVDHRNGVVSLAFGLFMIGYWYWLEREPFSADNSAEWPESGPELHESSTDFHPEELGLFLQRVSGLVQKGFSAREVTHVAQLASSLRHNDERMLDYEVTFEGRRIPLKITLFKGDVTSVGVAFFTSKNLARHLDQQIDLHQSGSGS